MQQQLHELFRHGASAQRESGIALVVAKVALGSNSDGRVVVGCNSVGRRSSFKASCKKASPSRSLFFLRALRSLASALDWAMAARSMLLSCNACKTAASMVSIPEMSVVVVVSDNGELLLQRQANGRW